ncbi:phosphotransferase (plasmid) [Legionella sp. D16C41]|uniref:phosphotransferase n=1 Tax=Legionella sp. D16C41 TaxID=3402688 RepID=UPI003AF842B0
MNNENIKAICSYFGFGKLVEPPIRVYGGLLHKMWYLKTKEGVYAIKELTKDINLTNQLIIDNYNLTEEIASAFIERGIPAVCAIKHLDNYLFIDKGKGFLVYPWIAAKSLDKDAIYEPQALQISTILAKLHQINLNIPALIAPQFDIHKSDEIIQLAQKSFEYKCPFSSLLKKQLNDLIKVNETYQQSIITLRQYTVVSHGDLDQKNVLWNELGRPILIDWESARKLNPTYEIVNASLDWSGITTKFNISLFNKMIEAYINSGGIIDQESFEVSFYGVLGNWINWLIYNLERACNSGVLEQINIGIEQVMQVLPTISRLNKLIPVLAKASKG